MKVVRTIILIIMCVLVVSVFYMQTRLIIPINTGVGKQTLMKLRSVGVDCEKVANGVDIASRLTDISEDMIIAIMMTESGGVKNAVSSKGYIGYMQIPYSLTEEDGNIIMGAWIFKEKLKLANGKVVDAICLYKGYPIGSEKGKRQAQKVLDLYYRLQQEVKT